MNPRSIIDIKIRPTLGVEPRSVLVAGAFLLFLCVFESILLGSGLPQWRLLFRQSDSAIQTTIDILYLLAGLYLLYLSILYVFAARWQYKLTVILFFATITLIEYSYQGALGRFTTSFDIDAAIAVTSGQRLDSIESYTSVLWLIPTSVLAMLCIVFKDRKKDLGGKPFLILVVIALIFYAQLSFVSNPLFGGQMATSSIDAFSQTSVSFIFTKTKEFIYRPHRETIESTVPSNFRPKNNIVLIFDESVRGDHLSLNGYPRLTTPFLQELARHNQLVNWGIASSASTTSLPSYDFFIVGATPGLLAESSHQAVNNMPSIFQYAKSMNYTTYMLDGQMKNYWGGIQDDLKYIDRLINMSDLDPSRKELWEVGGRNSVVNDKNNGIPQWEIDSKLATTAKRIFSESTGNFIFIYKRGVHTPYERNYPREESQWTPTNYLKRQWEAPSPAFREALINSYDNAIKYNLDRFFEALASDYSNLPNKTVIFYTSDHGEEFTDDGHGVHGTAAPEEARVPLFAFGLDKAKIDTDFKASHANVFTALLDLMQVPIEARKYTYAKSLLTATRSDSVPRFFNLIDGKKIPFE
jgi:glucan phosphoethanolaminetransferase (alkaline phosphatase superfamily)